MSEKDKSRPKFSEKDAVKISMDIFGVGVTAEELPSERDRNFLLMKEGQPSFVLKIATVSEDRATLEFQNAALKHFENHENLFSTPRVILSREGNDISEVYDDEGTLHYVRLLSYLPGKLFAKVNPHNQDFLYSYGRFLGSLSAVLDTFDHPSTHRDFYWDLKNSPAIISQYRGLIKDPSKRQLIDHFFQMFDERVVPRIRNLRTSVNHNDANDYNILVENSWDNATRFFGLLDYGDMVYTCTVFELAIALAYVILDKPDIISAATDVVRGFNQVFPLMEEEIELLFPMICQRLITSCCVQAYQQTMEPDNEYLGITVGPAWDALEKLRTIHPNLALYHFRAACGHSPHPNSDHIESWLKNNQSLFSSPIGCNLNETDFAILDLSVGSVDYGSPEEVIDTAKFIATVESKLKNENVSIALGRYNEARMIYASSQYLAQELADTRTVHIGLDFYTKPGTPVIAPLNGVVHSFRNNNLPCDFGPTIVLEHSTGVGVSFYTLYGHLSLDSISELKVGQPIAAGEVLARIGEFPINGGWPPHLHFQIILDMLDFEGDYYGVCWPDHRSIWTRLCPDPNLILGISEERFPQRRMTAEEILAEREMHFGRNLSVSYKRPIKMVRGYMQYLYDEDGRQYLDCVNNVPHVGHSNPRVVKAIHDQVKVLNTNTRYLHDNLAIYARRLAGKFPKPLDVCYFVNSGSEANELAIRLAKAHTKRDGFIALEGAYHGNTDNLIGLSSYKHDGPGGSGPPTNVQVVPNPDSYRNQYGNGKNTGKKHAEEVRNAIEKLEQNGHPVAAFICEPVMSCAGQIVFPPDYLRHVYNHVRDAGGICIADEVQVGFGRMGSHFWGFETQGVTPDIVTLGKPIGNGHPLAAVVTTSSIAESFNNGMEFFSTTGGNTVSCAAGLAVLDIIETENLQENARIVGNYLKEGLEQLKRKYALIGDVRGFGLFLGVELVRPGESLAPAEDEAKYIVNRMRDLGVLMSVDGPMHNVLKIKPPIIFSIENADKLLSVLDLVLSEDFPQMAHGTNL